MLSELDPKTLVAAMSQFCDDIFTVSVWEDRYDVVKPGSIDADFPAELTGGSYSAMVAQFADRYIEPGQQANFAYGLSAECIFTHLSEDNPRIHLDYRRVRDGAPFYHRVHIVLIDCGAEGMPAHVLFAHQDITSAAKEQDLNDIAFSQLSRDHRQIAYVDLNRDSLVLLWTAPGEVTDGLSGSLRYREILEQIAEQTVLPEHREDVMTVLAPRHLRNMLDNGVPGVELSFRRQRGEHISWARTKVVPLNDYSPDNARVMWYIQDISEDQARAGDYLKKVLEDNVTLSQALSSEKQYRLALMADSYFYYTFDVSGDGMIREQFLSKDGLDLVEEISGMPRPVSFEIFCQKWIEQYKPVFARGIEDDIFTLAYLRSAFMRSERIIDVEVKQEPPKGSSVAEFIEMFIVLSEDELTGHIMACVIWKDISEFRSNELQARIALKDAYKVAEQANQAKSVFFEPHEP